MKKVLSIILTLVMLMPSVSNILVFAADTTDSCITIEDVYSFPGGTVDVEIVLSNNPGIYSLLTSFEYDSNALKLVSVTNGSAMDDVASFTPPKNMASGCKASWYYIDEPETYRDGSLVILTFEVLEVALPEKAYSVSVSNVVAEETDGSECDISIKNGKVRIINYLPGDVNGDSRYTMRKDVAELNQYIVDGCMYDPLGYAIQLNEDAADVNDDDKINIRDVILINKYIVDGCMYDPDGYAVKLLPHTPRCNHTDLTAISAKDATCTEDGNIAYWACECGLYFDDVNTLSEIDIEDVVIEAAHIPGKEATCTEAQTCINCPYVITPALGHSEVTIPGFAPDYGKEGLTDGTMCDACGEILIAQEIIKPLLPDEYSISYHYETDRGNTYFEKQPKNNTNPTKYTTQGNSIILSDPSVPGFTFKGWYDSAGRRWFEIPTGTTGNLFFLGRFEREVYTISFDTPDVDVHTTWYDEAQATNVSLKNSAKYTVDTGLSLPNPDKDSDGRDLVYGYSFVGWSDDNGFIVNSIKTGDTESKTLHANWISDRNKATSYTEYDDPIIIEDTDNSQFIFVYNIGRIDNVPLTEYTDLDGDPLFSTGGLPLNVTITERKTSRFEESAAKEIAESIANETTKSSGWTLSEDWNQVYGAEDTESDKQHMSEERTDSNGNEVGGKYFVSNSSSGSTYTSNESGSSSSHSAKITTEDSVGINSSYDKQTKKYVDAELSIENKAEINAGVEFPVEIFKVSAGVKNTTTIGTKVSSGRSDEEAFHTDSSVSSYVGTDTHNSSSAYNVSVNQNTNSWNTQNSYENSHKYSTELSVTNAIASEIEKTKKYNFTNSLGGSSVNNVTDLESNSTERTYSSSVVVANIEEQEVTKEYTFKNDAPGHYRLMRAGTVHVYAVVGFDIATSSYYTFTYNVLDDKTYDFMDFSTNGNFNDCENSVVTFDIPYEVNEYIIAMTSKTKGLAFEKGKVTSFTTPEDFDGTVVIPSYCADEPVGDLYAAHQTVELAEGLFMNNTDITTVILPTTVSEIPKDAFNGCTNLQNVIAFGVTSIGDNAFSGCDNLSVFKLDNMVESIGENAFLNAPSIKIMAKDSDVAVQAIQSGAQNITVDFAKITDKVEDRIISVDDSTKYLALQSSDKKMQKEFINVKIDSKASETLISNITFKNNDDTPLNITSETVTLAAVTVEDAPGLALIMRAENTDLMLHNNVSLNSNSDIVVLSKNINVSQATASTGCSLIINGEMLVCGTVVDNGNNLSVADDGNNTYEVIDSAEYNNYLTDVTIVFESNGGSTVSGQRIDYGTKVMAPEAPSKASHSFLGWYEDEACTKEFDFNTPVTSDITLYAKWELNEFTVIFDANEGSVSTTSVTVIYGNPYGELPTPTKTGYTFDGWYTEKTGGTKVAADTIVATMETHTLYAQWTANTYPVTFNGNGGTSSKSSQSVTYGGTYGTLPTATRDYYSFLGWYTAASGGTQVTASTKFTSTSNITLYAQWKQNVVSDWVLESTVPAGAQITSTKYKYTLTTTASSSDSTMSGYTQTSSEWIQSSSGTHKYVELPTTFDNSHSLYSKYNLAPLSAYNNGSEKLEITGTNINSYIYWHWAYNLGSTDVAGDHNRVIKPEKCVDGWMNFNLFEAGESTTEKGELIDPDESGEGYDIYRMNGSEIIGKKAWTNNWWRHTVYQQSWKKYNLKYYFKKTEQLESTSYPTASGSSQTVSNIQKYVQYRAK